MTLDFDLTDVMLYGDQESKYHHGYYGDYYYLPLIIACNHYLLMAYLRANKIDGACLGDIGVLNKKNLQGHSQMQKIIFSAYCYRLFS